MSRSNYTSTEQRTEAVQIRHRLRHPLDVRNADLMGLRQWVQMGPGRSGLSVAIDQMPEKEQKIVFVRLRWFETSMTANLAAIKARVESSRPVGAPT